MHISFVFVNRITCSNIYYTLPLYICWFNFFGAFIKLKQSMSGNFTLTAY